MGARLLPGPASLHNRKINNMTKWAFFISIISFESFLLGFHYRTGEHVQEDGTTVQLEVHELGIGILSIGIERYK